MNYLAAVLFFIVAHRFSETECRTGGGNYQNENSPRLYENNPKTWSKPGRFENDDEDFGSSNNIFRSNGFKSGYTSNGFQNSIPGQDLDEYGFKRQSDYENKRFSSSNKPKGMTNRIQNQGYDSGRSHSGTSILENLERESQKKHGYKEPKRIPSEVPHEDFGVNNGGRRREETYNEFDSSRVPGYDSSHQNSIYFNNDEEGRNTVDESSLWKTGNKRFQNNNGELPYESTNSAIQISNFSKDSYIKSTKSEKTDRIRNNESQKKHKKFEKLQEYKGDIDAAETETSKPSKNNNGLGSLGNKCGLDVPRRIIGGTNTDIDEFPWLGLLQYWDGKNISHDCGGVLISKRYVLTAAHCTNGPAITSKHLKLRKVRLGEWDLSTDEDCQGEVCSSPVQEIDVEEIVPHEGYKPRGKSQVHDIALVRLKTEANLNQYVQPICLPLEEIGNVDYEGKKLTVSGWGRTSNARNSASQIKKKVDLPVVDWEKCSQFYNSYYGGLKIFKSQFCAGGEAGQDSCQGDSGGPLMMTGRKNNEMHWYLIGIVSSGPAACGVEDRPSLYTNVSQYTDWILKNIKN